MGEAMPESLQVCLPVSTVPPEQALEMISLDKKISRDINLLQSPAAGLCIPMLLLRE